MIHGYSYPKFYIYDSTGVTLQKTISLSPLVLADKPIIDEIKLKNTSPITRTKLQEALGYYYRQTLTAGIGDYNSTLLQYQADQANSSRRNDIFKLQQVLTYCNAGYVVKYTPHADLEDLWGFSPFTVFVTLEDLGYTGTNKTDSITVTVEATALTSSAFLWYEFSFIELNGVTNSTQCINFDGSNDVGQCTEFNAGKTHTIEFWMDQASPSSTEFVIYSSNGAVEHSVYFSSTSMGYVAGGTGQTVSHGGMSAGTKNHWLITRSGTAVVFYKNGVSLGSATLGANNDWYVRYVGAAGAASYLSAKLGHVRIYQSVLTSTQIALQYNAGYGNWPADVSAYAIWEMDGSGGTSTTEDNQETTASRDLTLTGSPSRTTW